jgi:hypothetical protein
MLLLGTRQLDQNLEAEETDGPRLIRPIEPIVTADQSEAIQAICCWKLDKCNTLSNNRVRITTSKHLQREYRQNDLLRNTYTTAVCTTSPRLTIKKHLVPYGSGEKLRAGSMEVTRRCCEVDLLQIWDTRPEEDFCIANKGNCRAVRHLYKANRDHSTYPQWRTTWRLFNASHMCMLGQVNSRVT